MDSMQKQPGAKGGSGFISEDEHYIKILSLKLLTLDERDTLLRNKFQPNKKISKSAKYSYVSQSFSAEDSIEKYDLPDYCEEFLQ